MRLWNTAGPESTSVIVVVSSRAPACRRSSLMPQPTTGTASSSCSEPISAAKREGRGGRAGEAVEGDDENKFPGLHQRRYVIVGFDADVDAEPLAADDVEPQRRL